MKRHPRILAQTLTCISLLCAALTPAETILQWDFNSGNLSASNGGQPLTYYDYNGAGETATQTAFGTTTALGIPNINGVAAAVMHFPACTVDMGYQMPTPAANGAEGATEVNDYTLIMDLLFTGPAANAWRSLIQIDDPAYNSNDGDFFIRNDGTIGISSKYEGKILSNTWHRVGIVLDFSNGAVLRKYIDGTLVGTHTGMTLDGRWALAAASVALLFTDNSGETADGYVNSIQLRDRALSSGEMTVLGGPSAAGIPTTISAVPSAVEQVSPTSNAVNVAAFPTIAAVIHRGTTTINLTSVKLSLDGTDLPATVSQVGDRITASNTLTTALSPLSQHVASVRYTDSVAGAKTNTWSFTVANYQSVTLPAPIYLETFDELAEGTLPAGWTVTNNTTVENAGESLDDPASDSYLNWVVIETNRVASIFGTPTITVPSILANGTPLNLISNNIIYATSDYRANSPSAQVQVLFTSDYNLAGRANVYLVFNSIFEQNEDSLGAVEYSTDAGNTWQPLLYMVDASRIVRDLNGNVDAVATFNTARADQPYGQSFGTFLGAPITPALAPFIRAGVNDSSTADKRVEVLRCPAADNQSAVRFRFVQAGSYSWYFGLDNVGLYSITTFAPPTVTVSPTSQTDAAGMTLTYFTSGVTGMAPLSYQWYRDGAIASGKTEAQLFLANAQASDSGSYTLVASNPGGSATSSPPVTLTISPMPMALPTGQWDFKLGDLRATIGQPLQYFDAQVQTDTSFGTTTSFGIPDIGGQAVPVMYCAPAGGTPWGGYRMHHSVAPNGGGTNVNQYTLILDVYYPSSSTGGYRGLWQTETNNTSDSDLFVHSDNRIGIDQIYHGSLTPDTWHRLVFAFDLTQRELGKYIDGVSVLAAPAGRTPLGLHNAQYLPAADGSVDARWALGPTVLLLADGDDGEVRPVYVSSVQIRNGRMGDAAIAALGGPSASKIPGAAVFRAERSGSSVVIDWTGTVLESAPTLAGPWATVVGAAQPYTVTAPTDNRFYRVRQ